MWTRMFVMMVGRVTIGTFTAAMLAVMLAALWLFAIEPVLPDVTSFVDERWYWFKDWFLRQLR